MKINSKIFKILLISLLCIISCSCNVYARQVPNGPGRFEDDFHPVPIVPPEESTPVDGDSATGLPTLDNNYKPTADVTGSKSTIQLILGVLTVIGVVAIVVGTVLIGFNTILGSASEKAIAQEKYVGLVIAAVIIIAGSTIAKFLISTVEKL